MNWCDLCMLRTSRVHDHRSDSSGLDDGILIGRQRKKPEKKPAAELREIRLRAWQTRRLRYGAVGHG